MLFYVLSLCGMKYMSVHLGSKGIKMHLYFIYDSAVLNWISVLKTDHRPASRRNMIGVHSCLY